MHPGLLFCPLIGTHFYHQLYLLPSLENIRTDNIHLFLLSDVKVVILYTSAIQ